jgi:hypothetical protein
MALAGTHTALIGIGCAWAAEQSRTWLTVSCAGLALPVLARAEYCFR